MKEEDDHPIASRGAWLLAWLVLVVIHLLGIWITDRSRLGVQSLLTTVVGTGVGVGLVWLILFVRHARSRDPQERA